MIINRYRAKSLKSAMDKVSMNMGPDARVLYVRQLYKRSNGSRGHPYKENSEPTERVEIVAVAEEAGDKIGSPSSYQQDQRQMTPQENGDYRSLNLEELKRGDQEEFRSFINNEDKRKEEPSNIPHQAEPATSLKRGKGEPHEMKTSSAYRSDSLGGPQFSSARARRHTLQMLHETLIRNHVDNEITYEILSLLNDDSPIWRGQGETSQELDVRDCLSFFIKRRIETAGIDTSKRATILIGPTGVGKTTTLAKLAALAVFQQEKTVGLITIDAYRIAAIDQLRTYAQIMSIPLKVALTPEELEKCIADLQDMDIILIDTPGRSHLNTLEIKYLEEFLEAAQPADTHLLVSAGTREDDAYAVVENFAPRYVQKFIFTKLDETLSFGSIFNVCIKARKPISYLTMGQNVPDDIRLADAEYLVDLFTANRISRGILQ